MSVTQSCLTLCDPIDCSPPGSSVHGILQARILEWVASPFSRGSPWPRDEAQVSYITGRFFTFWATRGALYIYTTYWETVGSCPGEQPHLWTSFSLCQPDWRQKSQCPQSLHLSMCPLRKASKHRNINQHTSLSIFPLEAANTFPQWASTCSFPSLQTKIASF